MAIIYNRFLFIFDRTKRRNKNPLIYYRDTRIDKFPRFKRCFYHVNERERKSFFEYKQISVFILDENAIEKKYLQKKI
jgi:hypothetical protein